MSDSTVGAYEAKTHLAQLLDRVAEGERIVITRHGKPAAVLAPVDGEERADPFDAVAALRAFRKGRTLGSIEP
jgi:prevent-host-death family protein